MLYGNKLKVPYDQAYRVYMLTTDAGMESTWSKTLQKHAYAIYRDFFSAVNIENLIIRKLISLILIVGTH